MFRLREIERKDLRAINQWRNDSDLLFYLEAPYRFISNDVDEKWYDNYLHNRDKQVRCAIVSDESDDILGLVSLTDIDSINQSAKLHIMVGKEENRGKGLGTFAVTEIVKHAFLNLNIQRIELSTLEYNIKAQKLYEKVGFLREGIKRKSIYKNGQWVDQYIYGLLKDEFDVWSCVKI